MWKYKNQLFGLLGISIITGLILFLNGTVSANQSYFAPQASNTTSTTTPTFINNGFATTTIVYDSYSQFGTNEPSGYKPITTDGATLLVQLTASTTSTVLNWQFQYSQDGQDWYADNIVNTANLASTTAFAVAMPNSYSWTFASSTSLCDTTVTIATNNRGCKAIGVNTPVRYVRVIFTTTGANGEVYAQFIPRKQNP